MKSKIRFLISNVKFLKEIQFKDQSTAFLICFLISLFIWVLIKYSKEYDTVIQYPVVYKNMPEDKILINEIDSVIFINVKAKGFRLLSVKYLKRKKPVSFDLSKLEYKKKQDVYEVIIFTSDIQKNISTRLKYSNELISISPNTLTLKFEDVYSKKVPVKLNIELDFEKQYYIYDSISVEPDSILITTTETFFKRIKLIETEEKVLNQLNKNKSFSIPVKNHGIKNTIKLSANIVQVNIHLEKFTEEVEELDIDIINPNDRVSIKTFPEKVKITYFVALIDYNRVDHEMFKAQVNIPVIGKLTPGKLKVNIVQFPSFVKIRKIVPDKVEYIILK